MPILLMITIHEALGGLGGADPVISMLHVSWQIVD